MVFWCFIIGFNVEFNEDNAINQPEVLRICNLSVREAAPLEHHYKLKT